MALAASLALAGCGAASGSSAGDDQGSPHGTPTVSRGSGSITLTDVEGRTVTLKTPVTRVILGESRLLYMTGVLDKADPLRDVVGWGSDLQLNDPDTYRAYAARFPSITKVPALGSLNKSDFNTERALALHPQALIVEADDFAEAQQSGLVSKLAAIGAPTVVVDFRDQPLKDTVPSATLMGAILGRQQQAKEFAGYYRHQVSTTEHKVAGAKPPTTFLWRAAGLLECCNTFGNSNLGAIVTAAGGDNLGDALPGDSGALSPEKVISDQPSVIVATGGDWADTTGDPGANVVPYVSLGYDATHAEVSRQLAELVNQPGFSALTAFKQKRVHALWHQFYDSPYNFMALEAIAKWDHPALFRNVDLDTLFARFHKRFLPVPYKGEFFVSLGS